uniref:Putative rRNA methyltransferase n=1 Tax=Strigamia maritima TaxID=126957 RepID=T1IZM5_STRMM
MGKKTKVGKQRKDKYYQLAKETGFRSRSAFKLIQLNRKYEFLQKSQVLIDLCAAPGGWLQVATQHMPVASIIIGVDLVPIRPIHNVITIEDDITKNTCKQALKKQLQTWKADVILHDGAPNVGKNWLHDAFQQAQLTLQALKLATEFLMKGGWFITKVFRSKDYHALLWVFRQFFKKVYATKPQASRNESAEIFVVCQSYIAPDKIDPKFLDTKYVFEEVDIDPKNKLNIMQQDKKKKKKAEGYADGATMLFKSNTVTNFITNVNYLDLLNESSELFFDDEKMLNHALTTQEIKECCKDIKVLGKRDLRSLLSWRKKLREEFVEEEKEKKDPKVEVTQEELEEDEDSKVQREIEELKMEEAHELKRKKKKVLKVKKQLHDKMNLKMVITDDEPIRCEEDDLFKLAQMKSSKELTEVEKGDSSLIDHEIAQNDAIDPDEIKPKKTVRFYEKGEKHLAGFYSDEESESSDEDNLHKGDAESDDDEFGSEEEEDQMEISNPLVVDLETGSHDLKQKRKVDFWFGKESFEGLEKEEDEELEMEEITNYYKKKIELTTKDDEINELEVEREDEEDEEEEEEEEEENIANGVNGGIDGAVEKGKKKKRKNLDIEGLALGSLLIQSKKRKRDLIDNAWNRYTFGEEDAPDWFTSEEEKYNKKQIPVTKEMMEEFRDRLKEINARPIAKIAEAKSRKKRRIVKKMEKARKRAETITDAIDMTDREKVQQIKTIYKKASAVVNKKKEVTYVVSRKAFAAKKASRPAGVKGPYKVVDPRMKKDNRKNKIKDKAAGKKKGKRFGGKKKKSR